MGEGSPLRAVQESDAGILLRSYLKALGGLIVLQTVGIISGAVLVRVFPTQEAFGQFSLAQQVMGLAGLLIGAGIDGAMTMYLSRERHSPKGPVRFSTAYRFGLWYSLALALGMVLLAPWIAGLYDAPMLAPVLRVAAPALFGSAILNTAQSTNVAYNEFGTQAITTTIYQVAVAGATMGGAIFFSMNPAQGAMGVSTAVGLLVACVVMLHAARRRGFSLYPFGTWEQLPQMARYGVPLWLGNMLKAYQQPLILTITGFVSMVEVGLISNAWKLTGYVGVVTWGFMIVTIPYIAENPDPDVQHRRTRLAMRFNHYIVFPLGAAAAFYATPLVTFVFGSAYADAARYVPVAAMATCASALARLGSQCLAGVGRTKLVTLVMAVPGVWVLIGGPLLIPRWVWSGPWLLVAGWIVSATAAVWLLGHYNLKLNYAADLGRPLVATLVMFAGAFFGRMAGGFLEPVLALAGLAAGVALIYRWEAPQFRESRP